MMKQHGRGDISKMEQHHVSCQAATYKLFTGFGVSRSARNSARFHFRIAPTALFDERGVLASWLQSKSSVRNRASRTRSVLAKHLVVYRGREMTNLLCLLSEWEGQAQQRQLPAVCLSTMPDSMPACLDAGRFQALVRTLAVHEAEVRADTVDSGSKSFVKGPFFVQAYVPAADDVQFFVTFRAARSLDEGHEYDFGASRRSDTVMDDPRAQSEQSESDGVGVGETQRVEAGTEAELRNELNQVVAHFEDQGTVLHMVSLYFVRDCNTGELVLTHAANLACGPMPELSSVSQVQEEVTACMEPQPTPQQDHHEEREEKMDALKSRPVRSSRQPWKPSSTTPTRQQRRMGSPGVPEKPYHNAVVLRVHRTEEMLATSKKLAEARHDIARLEAKVSSLQRDVTHDEWRLKQADAVLRASKQDNGKTVDILRDRTHDLERRQRAKDEAAQTLAHKNADLAERLEQETAKRRVATASATKAEKRLSQLTVRHEDLRGRYIVQDGADAVELRTAIERLSAALETAQREGQQSTKREEVLAETNTRLLRALEHHEAFSAQLFYYLCDPKCTGVEQPPNTGDFAPLPQPSPSNVRVAVRALVDGGFSQSDLRPLARRARPATAAATRSNSDYLRRNSTRLHTAAHKVRAAATHPVVSNKVSKVS